MISAFHRGNAFSHLNHHGTTFMSEDGRKQLFGICTRQGVCVCMTDPRCHNFQQNFPVLR